MILKSVKFTFFEYPFPIEVDCKFEDIIKLPDLLNLAAMKAFALGRRSKWKDYVDIYVKSCKALGLLSVDEYKGSISERDVYSGEEVLQYLTKIYL